MRKALQHLALIQKHDDYQTPTPLFKFGCKHFKTKPKIDVAASKHHHKCPRYFTLNALQKQWNKDFFCNPPYSEVGKFIKYGYEQHLKHNVNGLFLVYAKTDTKWFHEYVQGKAEIYFLRGRVKFWIKGRVPKWCKECQEQRKTKSKFCYKCRTELIENPSPYPSMFVFYRKKKRNKTLMQHVLKKYCYDNTKHKKKYKRIGLID